MTKFLVALLLALFAFPALAGPTVYWQASNRKAYASGNVTTSAYVELFASTTATISAIEIFDSSGQTLQLATGAAGSEASFMIVTPGGNGFVPVSVPLGTRISIKALSGTASSGESDINLYR